MDRRGVSTVVDVSIALLLISASIAVIAYAVADDGGTTARPDQADYMAETVSSMTLSFEYSIDPVMESNGGRVKPSDVDGYNSMTRQAHGTVPELAAAAAVSTAEFPAPEHGSPRPITRAGKNFKKKLSASLTGQLLGTYNNTQVIAVWRPYPESAINGTVTIGATPPADADVSTAILRVPCRIPATPDSRIERQYRLNGYAGAADPIARSIVAGYFPVEDTQVALETSGLRRALALAKYRRMGEMYGITWTQEGDALSSDTGGILGSRPLKRSTADAQAANQVLAHKLSDAIATDLESIYGSDATAEEIAADASTGRVTIVIRTW